MPERREVRQILLSCRGADACSRARRAIERLYLRLRNGASFAGLAKRYSDFPDAKVTGGKLWVERGQTVPAFDRLAFRLPTHELSRPFETQFGWHILQPLSQAVPVGPLIWLRVVGVKAATDPYPVGTVTLTPAFDRAYGFASRYSDFWVPVKLRHGAADIAALATATGADVRPEATDAAKIQRSIHHQAQALWLAAGFGALLALLLLAPALVRLAALAAGAHRTLRALGMTRRQLLAVDVARSGAIGALAAILAVALAFALSPLTPIGLARDLEPAPGFAFDPLVLGLGGIGVVLAVVVAGAVARAQVRPTTDLSAWRALRGGGRARALGLAADSRQRRPAGADARHGSDGRADRRHDPRSNRVGGRRRRRAHLHGQHGSPAFDTAAVRTELGLPDELRRPAGGAGPRRSRDQ